MSHRRNFPAAPTFALGHKHPRAISIALEATRFSLARISNQRLLALKRLVEVLDGDLLTLKEAQRGAAHIAPQFAAIFDGQPGQAGQVIQVIEAILQKRYPGGFRATSRR